MSLRWRWALSLGLVAALAIGLTAWAATLSAGRQLRGDVDADLLQRSGLVSQGAGILAGLSSRQEDTRDSDGGRRSRGDRHSHVVDFDAVIQVIDPDGEVVLRIGPEDVALPVDDIDLAVLRGGGGPVLRNVRIGRTTYRVITTPLRHPLIEVPTATAFQIARNMSSVNANLAGLTRRMALIGAFGILLAGIAGWILASRAVRPVTELTEVAEQIAATERLEARSQLNHSAPAEIGRLATAFSSMVSALASSRREQQRLVSDAGHEFRTPITALKTNLETLLRKGHSISDEQRRQMIEAALTESNQLADLATELVDLSTDIHQSEEGFERIATNELAAEIAHRFQPIAGQEVTVTGAGATVSGRRSQLERALSNLVDNAVKWAAGQIEIHLDGGNVTVIDDGPGVAEKDLPHIFQRFYRSSHARATPGSGLGLAIVKHLIVAHGGEVFAANRPEGGRSRFQPSC